MLLVLRLSLVLILLVTAHSSLGLATETPSRDPRAGIYVIWYPQDQADKYLGQPYVVGGQIMQQWAQVEPSRGEYDFSSIDEALADFNRRGLGTTLQINGNRKPAWLYDAVPSIGEKLSVQVSGDRTLMYWHDTHREAYLSMLRALGEHMKRSPHRNALLGVRLNFNAFGTEHHSVSPEYRDPAVWDFPEGVSRESAVEWTRDVGDEYIAAVVDTYIESLDGVCRIFVRNGVPVEVEEAYRDRFEDGTLSWFHTSSEAEPRALHTEWRYLRFHGDCRSGKTTAYAEPWASCWGHHGGQTDDRWCSPPQWMYWRVLSDLHCGVSYIALYATDMRVAVEGTYHCAGQTWIENDTVAQREFQAAIDFASKYAGYHALPRISPGAWVAFRENAVVRAENGMSEKQRTLTELTGDYDFLMRRLPGDRSVGQDVVNIGPDDQRFGAWARKLPSGDAMRFEIDERFTRSLEKPAMVAVTYLDEPDRAFAVTAGDASFQIETTGTNRWRTFECQVSSEDLETLTITSGRQPVLLHMIEVRR